MNVNFAAGQCVKKLPYQSPKQNYSGRRRIDIHATQTPSIGYRADVDLSNEGD